jgi:hypothetical protein
MERNCKERVAKLLNFGGASRDRTDDLIVANDALSQLSYSPTEEGTTHADTFQPALSIIQTTRRREKPGRRCCSS